MVVRHRDFVQAVADMVGAGWVDTVADIGDIDRVAVDWADIVHIVAGTEVVHIVGAYHMAQVASYPAARAMKTWQGVWQTWK